MMGAGLTSRKRDKTKKLAETTPRSLKNLITIFVTRIDYLADK